MGFASLNKFDCFVKIKPEAPGKMFEFGLKTMHFTKDVNGVLQKTSAPSAEIGDEAILERTPY